MKDHQHSYSFFGSRTAVLLNSAGRSDPFFFLRFIKERNDGSWEKPSQGGGKAIKFSLEEMVMILAVLKGKREGFSAYHSFNDSGTSINFARKEDSGGEPVVFLSAGAYRKALNYAQIEILTRLLEHLLEEKVEFATRQGTASPSQGEVVKDPSEPETRPKPPVKKEGTSRSKSPARPSREDGDKDDDISEVEGSIKVITDKALLVSFPGGEESWVPKSMIRNDYREQKDVPQDFFIDTWILRKAGILP